MSAATRVRPELREIPLSSVLPVMQPVRRLLITMSVEQWDGLLACCYEDGWILLELDDAEKPVRAYQRAESDMPAEVTS